MDEWQAFHFAQANPAGEGQDDVPALLRCVAESIAALGDVRVMDVVFHTGHAVPVSQRVRVNLGVNLASESRQGRQHIYGRSRPVKIGSGLRSSLASCN